MKPKITFATTVLIIISIIQQVKLTINASNLIITKT